MKKKLSFRSLSYFLLLLMIAFWIANNNSFINQPGQITTQSLPDLTFHYTPDHFYDYLDTIGSSGREALLKFYFYIDFIFPIVYSTLGYLILTVFIQRMKTAYLHKLAFISFLCGLLDITENVLNIIQIKRFPDISHQLSKISTLITSGKLIAFVIFIIVLLYTVTLYFTNKSKKTLPS